MDIEKINYNEVLISGKINNIKHFNNYIAFGLTCNTFAKIKSNCFISFHVYEDLYNIYKDLFYKNNKIFVKGYLKALDLCLIKLQRLKKDLNKLQELKKESCDKNE